MDEATLQAIHDVTFAVTSAVVQPFFAVVRETDLLYWPYLLSALILTVAVYALTKGRRRGVILRGHDGGYFSRAVWWHPSARADYRFYVVNAILFPVLFGLLLVSDLWIADRIRGLLDALFGAREESQAGVASYIVYTVLFFLLYDFGRFFGHYIQHRSDLLWAFHKVHHSAEVLTPISNARAHPVDLLCMWTFAHALTGMLLGVFSYLHGGTAGFYTFLGLHIGIFVYNIFGNLRHSHVWLSYGPKLSRVFISPAMHQIHHSVEERHFGHNIGYALSVWDWMFGTLYVPRGEERFEIGLGDGSDARYHGVLRMYFVPLGEIAAGFRARLTVSRQP